jgi:hypothetical protein
MSVMSTPGIWSGQDRMLTVADMEDMPDELIAQVAGDNAFEPKLPFRVTIVPSALVTTGPLG